MRLSQRLARAPLRRVYQTKRIIPLGPWRPDLPTFGNEGIVVCTNAIPHFKSFKSFPALTISTTALTARCQGATTETDKDSNAQVYAGDATKLYGNVDNTFTDFSKSGGYTISADETWEFAKHKNQMFATNIADPVQEVTMGQTTFADLFTSTLKPKARHMDVVRNRWLVLGNVEENSTRFTTRVRFSAIDNPADMDASAVNLSGFQDLEGPGGWIQKIVGGRDYGLIFQERQIQRMEFIGSPEIYRFDEVEVDRGAFAQNAVIALGRFVFYLAEDGFYVFDGVQSTPIGDGKVNRDFFAQLDATYLHRITAAIFFDHSCIVWSYTTSASAGAGDPDLMLLYHWPSGEWAEVDLDTEIILTSLSQGRTLEGLDAVNTSIDALEFSLDSSAWQGGVPVFAGFNRAHKMGLFEGTGLAASFDTGAIQFNPGEKATIRKVRSLVDGTAATTTVAVGTRDRLVASNSFGSTVSLDANGEHTFRGQNTRARYHQFRLAVSGGFDHAQGVEVEWGGGGTQ